MAIPKYISKEIRHNFSTWTQLSNAIAEFQQETFWASRIDYSSESQIVKVTSTKKLIAKLEAKLA